MKEDFVPDVDTTIGVMMIKVFGKKVFRETEIAKLHMELGDEVFREKDETFRQLRLAVLEHITDQRDGAHLSAMYTKFSHDGKKCGWMRVRAVLDELQKEGTVHQEDGLYMLGSGRIKKLVNTRVWNGALGL